MYKVFKKGGGEIKKEAGKGLTFFKMFRMKQKEDRKGLTFGGLDFGRFNLPKLEGVGGIQGSTLKRNVGLTKSYIKRVAMVGFVVVNVLSLVLAPVGNVPVGGAEAAFRLKTI